MYLTPCIGVCRLDPNTYICEGCGRTAEQIAEWIKYSDEQRMEVMKSLGYGKRRKRYK